MINKKLLTLLCGAWLMGAVAMAASPAVIEDAPKAVYTHDDGRTLTIQYPSISIDGNAGAAALMAQYFADEQAQAREFFAQQGTKGVKLTEEKHYTVTLNNGKYLSFLDEGYLYFDRAAHPTSWKTGVVFDMETGRRITNWRELVKPGDEKAFTLQKITNKLTLSDNVLSTYFNGLTEDPKNFYLDKKGNIHFIFGQYEVAPYSSGIIDINMGKQAK